MLRLVYGPAFCLPLSVFGPRSDMQLLTVVLYCFELLCEDWVSRRRALLCVYIPNGNIGGYWWETWGGLSPSERNQTTRDKKCLKMSGYANR